MSVNYLLVDAIERRLQAAVDRALSGDDAVVTATSTNPNRVTVSYREGSFILPYLSSYSPTVGDVVKVVGPTNGWYVIGKVA